MLKVRGGSKKLTEKKGLKKCKKTGTSQDATCIIQTRQLYWTITNEKTFRDLGSGFVIIWHVIKQHITGERIQSDSNDGNIESPDHRKEYSLH